jgi:hypothetical protein
LTHSLDLGGLPFHIRHAGGRARCSPGVRAAVLRRGRGVADYRSIDVQADSPAEAQRANWLPVPKGSDFSPFLRAYWPKTPIIDGSWTPPAVMKAN